MGSKAEVSNYVYLPLKDAVLAIEQKVNLMAVIVECGLPEKSKGSDWFCNLKIIDESYQGHGVSVNVFDGSEDNLPHVKSVGDIIRFSQVVMKSHKGKVNVLFKKKISTFALFEGKSGKSFIAYQTSSCYGLRDPDKRFITSLRIWLLNYQLDSGGSESIKPLKQLLPGKCFDLLCKILKVDKAGKDKWRVFLWDGTDAPPLTCRTPLINETENPVPLQRDVLREFPPVGTILTVTVTHASEKVPLQLPSKWVKFTDFYCEEHLGSWFGQLSFSTRIRILSDEDVKVKHYLRAYEERLESKWGRMPSSAFPSPSNITKTDHEDVPITTLRDVITYPEVASKFKCVVRVVAIYPWGVEDYRSPLGTRVYRIRLTLEDPTARIHAILYAEDGEKFFDGYPCEDVLRSKRNKLVGILENDDLDAARNPPWVEMCLKSYCLEENEPWKTKKYRVFDTKIVL